MSLTQSPSSDDSLQPEEYKILLDTLISALAVFRVEMFQTKQPTLRQTFEERRAVLESLLRKISTIVTVRETDGLNPQRKSTEEFEGKAA